MTEKRPKPWADWWSRLRCSHWRICSSVKGGDEFFLGDVHDRCARQLAGMLLHHYRYSPVASVHLRPKLIGPDRSLPQPTPDVVVVNHLLEPHRSRPAIDLPLEQAANSEGEVAIRAIFEVTSPRLADVVLETKRALYERLGASEYWVIDTGLRPEIAQPRLNIVGYELRDGVYQPIKPTSERRWESKACRLWLSVSDDRQSVQLGDLRTGKLLPMPADGEDPSISTQAEAARRAQSIAGQLKL